MTTAIDWDSMPVADLVIEAQHAGVTISYDKTWQHSRKDVHFIATQPGPMTQRAMQALEWRRDEVKEFYRRYMGE